MRVQFEWQAGNENDRWEIIARIEKRAWLKRIPRWMQGTALALSILLVLGGYVGLRRAYNTALQRIAFQIQSVIDLEAQALARRDVDLFLAQQDKALPGWVTWQAACTRAGCLEDGGTALESCSCASSRSFGPSYPLDLSAEVQRVALRGDTAWVEVIAGQELVRQARFYRQTDLGWLHTAPQVEFWKEPVERAYEDVIVRCYQRDLAYVEPLVTHILQVRQALCATLACHPGDTLAVDFVVGTHLDSLPAYSEDGVILVSPWLSGIPVAGTWDGAYLEEVTHRVAYAVTAQHLRSKIDRDLNPLQRAILAEYAALVGHEETMQAPLLRRVVERHGMEALPELLDRPDEMGSLSQFMAQWLDLTPSDRPVAYFETILNVEREAILAGQKDTFLLLQRDDGQWMALQAASYDQIRSGAQAFSFSPAKVQNVTMVGDRACVTLEEQISIELEGSVPGRIHRVAFFSREDGDWRRSWHSCYPQAEPLLVPPSTMEPTPALGESR